MEDACPLTSLPDDPRTLKALVLTMARQRDQLAEQRDHWKRQHDHKENQRQAIEIEKLRLEVELLRLRKWYYGRKADQLTGADDAAQLVLDFARQLEALPPPQVQDVQAIADDDTPADLGQVELKTVRKVRRGRRNLADFEHLPVIRKEHDLPEDDKPCPCCGQMRCRIGQERSWQLEYIPGHFERIEHVRHKYACPHCEQQALSPRIELADKPSAPIDKGLPGPGLLAHVVMSKYADYLPLYRLEDSFARAGVQIGRATMSVWCCDVANLLRPLYQRMIRRVLASGVIATDDTIMPMLEPGQGKTRQARMWVYVGDESSPYNLFDFTLGRSRDGPAGFLDHFTGTLLADAYGGYDGIVVGNQLTRAGCWAHARRKFVEAEKAGPAIAAEAVKRIARLYQIEHQARDLSHARRLALRQARSRPVLDALHERLSRWSLELVPKHPMNEAIGYALRQWKALSVFADDGAVPIDNNISEREMKRIVLNRKNSLFVGNERGGQTSAILASFTSTCRRHQIDPQRYLTHLLTNLPDTPLSQLDQWLPDAWKQQPHAPPTPDGK